MARPSKLTEETSKFVSRAVFTAMWPNQPVKVCESHAQSLINVGQAIGLQVPLLPFIGEEPCINCINEAEDNGKAE